MPCEKCGAKLDDDAVYCHKCGNYVKVENKESGTQEIINDYLKTLSMEGEKTDTNEDNEDRHNINNLSIDLEKSLSDVSKKLKSTHSNNTDTIIREFGNLLSREAKPLEDSFDYELKEFGDSIKNQIEQINVNIDIMSREIDERNEKAKDKKQKLDLEKKEFLSSLINYQMKNAREESGRQKIFDQKRKDLEEKTIAFEEEKNNKQRDIEQKYIDIKNLQEGLNQKQKDIEQKQKDVEQKYIDVKDLQEELDKKQKDLEEKTIAFEEEKNNKQRDIEQKYIDIKNLQEELDQKQKDIEGKNIDVENKQKNCDKREKELEDRQRAFSEQIVSFGKESKAFEQKKKVATIILAVLFVIFLISLLVSRM